MCVRLEAECFAHFFPYEYKSAFRSNNCESYGFVMTGGFVRFKRIFLLGCHFAIIFICAECSERRKRRRRSYKTCFNLMGASINPLFSDKTS